MDLFNKLVAVGGGAFKGDARINFNSSEGVLIREGCSMKNTLADFNSLFRFDFTCYGGFPFRFTGFKGSYIKNLQIK